MGIKISTSKKKIKNNSVSIIINNKREKSPEINQNVLFPEIIPNIKNEKTILTIETEKMKKKDIINAKLSEKINNKLNEIFPLEEEEKKEKKKKVKNLKIII